jgi:hypothetical protein
MTTSERPSRTDGYVAEFSAGFSVDVVWSYSEIGDHRAEGRVTGCWVVRTSDANDAAEIANAIARLRAEWGDLPVRDNSGLVAALVTL